MADVIEQIQQLPPDVRNQVRQEIVRQARNELVGRVLNDRQNQTLRALASVNEALVTGDATNILFERQTTEPDNPDLRDELVRRIELNLSLEDDLDAQARERKLCRADPHRFFDNWVWMIDPRRKDLKKLPFRLFDFQREAVDWISARYHRQETGIYKKSRDMGMSVICAGYGLYLWSFFRDVQVTYASRKLDLVDTSGDLDSLFEKIRFMLANLPDWLRPQSFHEPAHSKNCNLLNPDTGAHIKGEGGKWVGSGGRSSLFFVDEYSLIEQQQRTHQSLMGTAECVIYLYTSKGPWTYAYRLETRKVFPMLVRPWFWDPRKVDKPSDVGNPKASSKWEKTKREKMADDAAFAQEYECDDSKALEQMVIMPEWVEAARKLRLVVGSESVAGLDLADGGDDESVLIVRSGGVVVCHEAWKNARMKRVAREALPMADQFEPAAVAYDVLGIGAQFEGDAESVEFSSRLHPVNVRAKPTFRPIPDGTKTPARERFATRGAELWWRLRIRFEKTWERFHGKGDHPDDECICLDPDDDILAEQLLSRQWEYDPNGKVRLTEKRDGSGYSPDHADALALTEDEVASLQTRQARRSRVDRAGRKGRGRRNRVW